MTDDEASAAPLTPKEWNAAAYHRLSEPQFAWGRRVLQRLPLEGHERVLDAGCGSGRLTREIAERLEHGFVAGCDLSENMTHAAAETLGVSRFRAVVCADLLQLPFRDAAFDAVFSTATFHWVLAHDRLFAEIHRVLCDGGRLEAQCGGGPNLATVHARADALRGEPPFRSHFQPWEDPWLFASVPDTEVRLRRVGFSHVHCWLEETPTQLPNADRYRAFLESVVMRPYLSHLSTPALRARFLDALVERAATDHPPFVLDYWRLNISAAA